MQERPNKLALLTAISRFLIEEARPALADPRLNFRALIAAHLAHVVAAELASDEEAVAKEIERLRPFFPDVTDAAAASPSFEARRALASDLNARLAAKLRASSLGPEELPRVAALLRDSLREKLAIENPRFDTALEIE